MKEFLKMKVDEFKDVCEKLGMNKYFNIDDDFFWEALSSNSQTIYNVIDPQTPANLEEQINLFHKNYKEYLIQNKIKDINKDFKDEDNFFSIKIISRKT